MGNCLPTFVAQPVNPAPCNSSILIAPEIRKRRRVETVLTSVLNAPVEERRAAVSSESFDEIVRQHQRRIYRVLFLLLRDHDAADTLTQECFLRAYTKLAAFRGECRIDTWLLRIAVNLAKDHGKSRRVGFWKKLVGLEDAGAGAAAPRDITTPQPSPEQVLLAREELEAVWSTVASFSPQQRTIFILRFAEEMSLAEIAGVLGLSVGTVKAQLFRATGKVREMFKEQP
jgi:RNA polymerase sigma-70 factor, ECF subfamily